MRVPYSCSAVLLCMLLLQRASAVLALGLLHLNAQV